MPIITISLFSGRNQREKDRLAEAITQSTCQILKIDKKEVIIVFQEGSHGNWYSGGVRIWIRAFKRRKNKITRWNTNSGKLSEDPIVTQLRLADEEILEQMEKTGMNFGEYNALVSKRHKLYLKYEKLATDNTTRYLISTIRQNILSQIKISVLEAEIVKLTIRVENLEKKT